MANASGDEHDLLTVLEEQFGNDGYAFWYKLKERLTAAEGHYLDCRNPAKWKTICATAHVDEVKGEAIMVLLREMEAIDKDLWDLRVVWCQDMVNNLTTLYKDRKRSLPEKPRFTPENPDFPPRNDSEKGVSLQETPQSKVKQSKTKETIDPPVIPPAELAPAGAIVEEKTGKEIYGLPEYVDGNTWDEYLKMRKKKRAAPTDRAIELIIKDLEKYHGEGYDVNKILENSIKNNYTGVFSRKEFLNGKAGQNPQQSGSLKDSIRRPITR
jgi:hypothetical protein